MRCPNHISSLWMRELIHAQKEINGEWQPARPLGYATWWQRYKLAWWVFTGKADALTWPWQ